MGKIIKRKNKGVGVDFKRVKHKVGKKLKKADNETDTDFKTRAIHMPSQEGVTNDKGPAVNHYNLTLKELLGQVSHYSGKTRAGALKGLQDLFSRHPNELLSNLPDILTKLLERLADGEPAVRSALLILMRDGVLPRVDARALGPFAGLVMAHLCSALTHLSLDIRGAALKILGALMDFAPELVTSAHLAPCLSHFCDLLSPTQRSRSIKAQSLEALTTVLSALERFLKRAFAVSGSADASNASHAADGDQDADAVAGGNLLKQFGGPMEGEGDDHEGLGEDIVLAAGVEAAVEGEVDLDSLRFPPKSYNAKTTVATLNAIFSTAAQSPASLLSASSLTAKQPGAKGECSFSLNGAASGPAAVDLGSQSATPATNGTTSSSSTALTSASALISQAVVDASARLFVLLLDSCWTECEPARLVSATLGQQATERRATPAADGQDGGSTSASASSTSTTSSDLASITALGMITTSANMLLQHVLLRSRSNSSESAPGVSVGGQDLVARKSQGVVKSAAGPVDATAIGTLIFTKVSPFFPALMPPVKPSQQLAEGLVHFNLECMQMLVKALLMLLVTPNSPFVTGGTASTFPAELSSVSKAAGSTLFRFLYLALNDGVVLPTAAAAAAFESRQSSGGSIADATSAPPVSSSSFRQVLAATAAVLEEGCLQGVLSEDLESSPSGYGSTNNTNPYIADTATYGEDMSSSRAQRLSRLSVEELALLGALDAYVARQQGDDPAAPLDVTSSKSRGYSARAVLACLHRVHLLQRLLRRGFGRGKLGDSPTAARVHVVEEGEKALDVPVVRYIAGRQQQLVDDVARVLAASEKDGVPAAAALLPLQLLLDLQRHAVDVQDRPEVQGHIAALFGYAPRRPAQPRQYLPMIQAAAAVKPDEVAFQGVMDAVLGGHVTLRPLSKQACTVAVDLLFQLPGSLSAELLQSLWMAASGFAPAAFFRSCGAAASLNSKAVAAQAGVADTKKPPLPTPTRRQRQSKPQQQDEQRDVTCGGCVMSCVPPLSLASNAVSSPSELVLTYKLQSEGPAKRGGSATQTAVLAVSAGAAKRLVEVVLCRLGSELKRAQVERGAWVTEVVGSGLTVPSVTQLDLTVEATPKSKSKSGKQTLVSSGNKKVEAERVEKTEGASFPALSAAAADAESKSSHALSPSVAALDWLAAVFLGPLASPTSCSSAHAAGAASGALLQASSFEEPLGKGTGSNGVKVSKKRSADTDAEEDNLTGSLAVAAAENPGTLARSALLLPLRATASAVKAKEVLKVKKLKCDTSCDAGEDEDGGKKEREEQEMEGGIIAVTGSDSAGGDKEVKEKKKKRKDKKEARGSGEGAASETADGQAAGPRPFVVKEVGVEALRRRRRVLIDHVCLHLHRFLPARQLLSLLEPLLSAIALGSTPGSGKEGFSDLKVAAEGSDRMVIEADLKGKKDGAGQGHSARAIVPEVVVIAQSAGARGARQGSKKLAVKAAIASAAPPTVAPAPVVEQNPVLVQEGVASAPRGWVALDPLHMEYGLYRLRELAAVESS